MKQVFGFMAGLAGIAFAVSAAQAHHSFAAEFIEGSRGEVEGVVTRVWLTNPHVRYRLESTAEDGTVEEWELQLTSVTNLRRSEWFRDTVEWSPRSSIPTPLWNTVLSMIRHLKQLVMSAAPR